MLLLSYFHEVHSVFIVSSIYSFAMKTTQELSGGLLLVTQHERAEYSQPLRCFRTF